MTVEKAVHRLTEAGLKISGARETHIMGGTAIHRHPLYDETVRPIIYDERNIVNVDHPFSIIFWEGVWLARIPIGQVEAFLKITNDVLVAADAVCTFFEISEKPIPQPMPIAKAMFTLRRNGLAAEIDTPRKGILVRLNPGVFEDQRSIDKTTDSQILITPQEKRWQATLSENNHNVIILQAATIDNMVNTILREVENRPYFIRKPEEEQDS